LCIAVGRWFLLAVFIWVTTEVALTSAMKMTRGVAAALEKPFLHFFLLGISINFGAQSFLATHSPILKNSMLIEQMNNWIVFIALE
jgi:hypothetical protein